MLALDHFKPGKRDHTSLDSRHLRLAAPILAESLSGFFIAVVRHGSLPDQLKDCVLVLIPKAGKISPPLTIIVLLLWPLL